MLRRILTALALTLVLPSCAPRVEYPQPENPWPVKVRQHGPTPILPQNDRF
jgi:hypothetical protein